MESILETDIVKFKPSPAMKKMILKESLVDSSYLVWFYRIGRFMAHSSDREHHHIDVIDSMSYLSNKNSIQNNKNDIEPRLGDIHDVPEWYDVYDWILHGYRVNYDKIEATLSILTWHNETVCTIKLYIPNANI